MESGLATGEQKQIIAQTHLAEWRYGNRFSICCEKATPIKGGCVGSFCCDCPEHGQIHRGDHN
jgi:hypothetical protein